MRWLDDGLASQTTIAAGSRGCAVARRLPLAAALPVASPTSLVVAERNGETQPPAMPGGAPVMCYPDPHRAKDVRGGTPFKCFPMVMLKDDPAQWTPGSTSEGALPLVVAPTNVAIFPLIDRRREHIRRRNFL
mmetsp:Transcript_53913/g.121822  ORF Transcript_53913/g.121822 Transcript_53913/m.121822 type:complete len:133 (-) Transcript_53913:6-404(-)